MLDTHTHTHTGLSCPIKIMHSPYIVFLFVSGFLCLKVLAFQMLSGNIVTESSLVYLNGNLLCLYKCLWLYIRRRGGFLYSSREYNKKFEVRTKRNADH